MSSTTAAPTPTPKPMSATSIFQGGNEIGEFEIAVFVLLALLILALLGCLRHRRVERIREEAKIRAAMDWGSRVEDVGQAATQTDRNQCDIAMTMLIKAAKGIHPKSAAGARKGQKGANKRMSTSAAMTLENEQGDADNDGQRGTAEDDDRKIHTLRSIDSLPRGFDMPRTLAECIKAVVEYGVLNDAYHESILATMSALSATLRSSTPLVSLECSSVVRIPVFDAKDEYDPAEGRDQGKSYTKVTLSSRRMDRSCCAWRLFCICRSTEMDEYDTHIVELDHDILKMMLTEDEDYLVLLQEQRRNDRKGAAYEGDDNLRAGDGSARQTESEIAAALQKRFRSLTSAERWYILGRAVGHGWVPESALDACENLFPQPKAPFDDTALKASLPTAERLKWDLSHFLLLVRGALLRSEVMGDQRGTTVGQPLFHAAELYGSSLYQMLWKVRTTLLRVIILRWRQGKQQDFKRMSDQIRERIGGQLEGLQETRWPEERIERKRKLIQAIDSDKKEAVAHSALGLSAENLHRLFLTPPRQEKPETVAACCGHCLGDFAEVRRGLSSSEATLAQQFVDFVRAELYWQLALSPDDLEETRLLLSEFKTMMVDTLFPVPNPDDVERVAAAKARKEKQLRRAQRNDNNDDFSDPDVDWSSDEAGDLQTPKKRKLAGPPLIIGGDASPIAIIGNDPIEAALAAEAQLRSGQLVSPNEDSTKVNIHPKPRAEGGEDFLNLVEMEERAEGDQRRNKENTMVDYPPRMPPEALDLIDQLARESLSAVEKTAKSEADELERHVTIQILQSMPEVLLKEFESSHVNSLLYEVAPQISEIAFAASLLKRILSTARELCEISRRQGNDDQYRAVISRQKAQIDCLCGKGKGLESDGGLGGSKIFKTVQDPRYETWLPLDQLKASLSGHVALLRKRREEMQ